MVVFAVVWRKKIPSPLLVLLVIMGLLMAVGSFLLSSVTVISNLSSGGMDDAE